jgi:hypothetical protein
MAHIQALLPRASMRNLTKSTNIMFTMHGLKSYGGCKYGVFSAACPVQTLHAMENGLIISIACKFYVGAA